MSEITRGTKELQAMLDSYLKWKSSDEMKGVLTEISTKVDCAIVNTIYDEAMAILQRKKVYDDERLVLAQIIEKCTSLKVGNTSSDYLLVAKGMSEMLL